MDLAGADCAGALGAGAATGAAETGTAFAVAASGRCRTAYSRQPRNATASTSIATMIALSFCPIERCACGARASGESAGAVRRMPSGVSSKTHANATATGKPTTITTTTSRTTQLGMLKNGKTCVATCTSSQPATT